MRLAPKPVGDSLVLFGAEARLVALRADDGSVKWKSPRVEPSSLEMKVKELLVRGGAVYGSHVGRLIAWDLNDGSERWTFKPESSLYEIGYYGLDSDHMYVSGGGRLLAIDRQGGLLEGQYESGADGIAYAEGASTSVRHGCQKAPRDRGREGS